jgi:hypothetical protein
MNASFGTHAIPMSSHTHLEGSPQTFRHPLNQGLIVRSPSKIEAFNIDSIA